MMQIVLWFSHYTDAFPIVRMISSHCTGTVFHRIQWSILYVGGDPGEPAVEGETPLWRPGRVPGLLLGRGTQEQEGVHQRLKEVVTQFQEEEG